MNSVDCTDPLFQHFTMCPYMCSQTYSYIAMLFIHSVFNVSAQGGCTITPINPTTLTAAGGILASGTENVMIQCNCTDDNGTVIDPVRWYDPDGNRLVDLDRNSSYVAGIPHFSILDGADDNILLVIPTFNDTYDGTYTCGRRVRSGLPGPPNVTVILTIGGKLIHVPT